LPLLGPALADIDAGLARRQRTRAGFHVNNLIAWHVKANREAAFEEARRNLWVRGVWERARIAPYLAAGECELVQRALPDWQRAYANGSPDIPGVPRALVERLASQLTFTGGHDDLGPIISKLRRFAAAGIDEVSLRLYGDAEDSIRLIAKEVMPELR
ncbi:MAG: hypothetical protein L6Q83_14105, partial [Gammaproteobacteria bacterium]|nr:hypothetical protein [Gammaproteobacteria bacterium]